MSDIVQASLGIDLPDGTYLSHAEWWNSDSHFVVVKFYHEGEMSDLGLRFDLDKRVFLDDFGNAEADAYLKSKSDLVWSRIAEVRSELRNA